MDIRLQIILIVASFGFLGLILYMLRRDELKLRYSLLWLASAIVVIAIAIKPEIIILLSHLTNVEMPSNLVFTMVIAFLVLIVLSLTVAISKLSKRLTELTQKLALFEKEVGEKDNKS